MDASVRRPLVASALVCAALIYIYPLALSTPLLDPDEGLHAAISQEMAESGDFVTPTFLHEPFLDKPILYFASQALSLKCFGMNEAGVRAPGLFFGLLGALTTALVAKRLFDDLTALVSLLVALTSVIPLALAQAAAHDVALVPWTNLLLLCWWEAGRAESLRRRAGYAAIAGLLVALAFLTKGLIGVAVVAVGYTAYALILRQRVVYSGLCVAASLLLGALLASPWYIAMELRVPGYLHYYLIERHLKGYTTGTQLHGYGPWYYYVPLLLGGTAPWFIYIIPGVWQEVLDKSRGVKFAHRPTLFVLCWLLGGLGFLTIANSKLITYCLPLYPAMAILIGHACARFLRHEFEPWLDTAFARALGGCCAIGGVVPLALLLGLDSYNHSRSPVQAYIVAILASAVALFAVRLLYCGRRVSTFAWGSAWYALLFLVVMTWPMQRLAENLSQRALARELSVNHELPLHTVLLGSRIASVVFYLPPEQRRQLRTGQITEGEPGAIHEWSSLPPDTVLAVTSGEWKRWPNVVLPLNVKSQGVAGDYCLFTSPTNQPRIARQPGATPW